MPEHWRPKDIKLWRHITWESKNMQVNSSEIQKWCIFNFWPWSFTYDLYLQTPPRYCQGQCLPQILCPYVKVQLWAWLDSWQRHTDIQTDRTHFIPSTADAGGKKLHCGRLEHVEQVCHVWNIWNRRWCEPTCFFLNSMYLLILAITQSEPGAQLDAGEL